MKNCHLSLFAVGVSLATSSFAGITGLTDGVQYNIDLDFDYSLASNVITLTNGANSVNTRASLFKLDVTDAAPPITDYVVFCFEITEYAGDGLFTYKEDYGITYQDAFGNYPLLAGNTGAIKKVNQLNALFTDPTSFKGTTAGLWSGLEAQAFQLAVWEIVYDGGLDLVGGPFQVSNASAALISAAQALLNKPGVQGAGTAFGSVTLAAFISPTQQNQLTTYMGAPVIPVPEPSLLALQALFVGGLLFLRRRARR